MKDKGQPCKRGEASARTGCIPKKKPVPTTGNGKNPTTKPARNSEGPGSAKLAPKEPSKRKVKKSPVRGLNPTDQINPSHRVAKMIRQDKESSSIVQSLSSESNKSYEKAESLYEKQVAKYKSSNMAMKLLMIPMMMVRKSRYESMQETRAEQSRKHLASMLKPDKPMGLKISLFASLSRSVVAGKKISEWAPSRSAADAAKKGLAFVKSIANNVGDHQLTLVNPISGRSFYFKSDDADGNLIALSNAPDPATVAHEMGHFIEKNKKGVKEKASEFLKYRTEDTPIIDIGTLPGGSSMEGEKVHLDSFGKAMDPISAAYAGKIYAGGSTELVSMGLENLYRDPAGFAKKDPEYCQWIIGILRS